MNERTREVIDKRLIELQLRPRHLEIDRFSLRLCKIMHKSRQTNDHLFQTHQTALGNMECEIVEQPGETIQQRRVPTMMPGGFGHVGQLEMQRRELTGELQQSIQLSCVDANVLQFRIFNAC